MGYEKYLETWSVVLHEQRRDILEKTLAADAQYLNAMMTGDDVEIHADHLDEFQQPRPAHRFILDGFLTSGQQALGNWQMRDPARVVAARTDAR